MNCKSVENKRWFRYHDSMSHTKLECRHTKINVSLVAMINNNSFSKNQFKFFLEIDENRTLFMELLSITKYGPF